MMTTRIALVALAVLAAVPATTPAQERPTVDGVLERFAAAGEEDFDSLNKAGNDARSLLRQVDGPLPAEEIEALIEGLVEIALAPDAHTACAYSTCASARRAGSVLMSAVWRPGVYVPEGTDKQIPLPADYNDIQGVPVPEAFDALVRIYETLAERALAEGGDDPFLEAARRDHAHRSPDGHATTFEHWRLFTALLHIVNADLSPDGRGWAYVLGVFERSKPPCRERAGPPNPPDCTTGLLGSAWCAAGRLLHRTTLGEPRPWPAPDRDLWEHRCGGERPWNSSRHAMDSSYSHRPSPMAPLSRRPPHTDRLPESVAPSSTWTARSPTPSPFTSYNECSTLPVMSPAASDETLSGEPVASADVRLLAHGRGQGQESSD